MRRCGPVVELTDEAHFSLADRAGAVSDWPNDVTRWGHPGLPVVPSSRPVDLRNSARPDGHLATPVCGSALPQTLADMFT